MNNELRFKRNPSVKLISNNLYIDKIHLFNCGVDGIKILEASKELEREQGAFLLKELENRIIKNGNFQKNNINSLGKIFDYLVSCNIFTLSNSIREHSREFL